MENAGILRTEAINFWYRMEDMPQPTGRHTHGEYEIYYLLQGDVMFHLEDQGYIASPRSLLLIPPAVYHEWRLTSRRLSERVAIHFQPGILDDAERTLLPDLFQLKHPYFADIASCRMDSFVQSVLECRDMNEYIQKIALRSRLVSLLTQIHWLGERTVPPPPAAADGQTGDTWIKGVIEYLHATLREPLSLDTVARQFRVSKNHLNVRFRRETGATVNQYIREQRVYLAHRELLAGCHAEEAAYNAGFNDYSNFFRAYKMIFGVSPRGR
jgi:AraC-like DNA-binding protein